MTPADGVSSAIRFCPSCHQPVDGFRPGGVRGRPNARCPRCGALERHRFLAVLLDGLAPVLAHASTVVDIAPSRYTTEHIDRLSVARYIRVDLDPAADGRAVDLRGSVTHLPLASGSVDLLLCYHVLEHVPDDRAGMREIARVLAPGGRALVQVPFRAGEVTDEDPDAPVQERIERFGQADHVRRYGADFEDRLVEAGLSGSRIHPVDVLGEELVAAVGVRATEPVWILRRAGDHERPEVERLVAPPNRLLRGLHDLAVTAVADRVAGLEAAVDELTRDRDRLKEERDRVKAERDRWRARHERITHHPIVKAAAAPYRWLQRR